MVRLFLCEDEIVMRDGIKKHIEWEKEGIEFVGEASDGELAYPMILEQKPDILLTDIKMPFMDGLELAELVKKELPDIRIIILSGYDEFAYAQKAVSLGVTEYLLKPISPSKLKESIRSVAEKIEEERLLNASEAEWAREEEEERREIEIHRLFDTLIMNDMSTSEVLEKAKKLDISLTARTYQMTRIYLSISGAGSDSFSEIRNSIAGAITEKVAELSAGNGAGCIAFDRGIDGFAMLVLSDDEEETASLTKEMIADIQVIMGAQTEADYFIGVGNIVNRLSEIRYSYDEANKALAHRFLNTGDKVIFSDKYEAGAGAAENKGELNIHSVTDTESPHKVIEKFLKTGMSDEAEPLMDSVFATLGEQNIRSMIFLNYVTMDIYFAMARFLKEIGADAAAIEKECGDINAVLSQSKGADEIRIYLKHYLKAVVEARDKKAARKYSRLLHNAISYIDENYANDDISLNTVASTVNISPNHFSTIFSQEVGQTFIEYLIGKRMERAKELLMTTDMRSSEIAYAVGYKDPHYFSYTFKKTQGMTSREFRARGKAENV